jgi:hypothetical protein
MKLEYTFTRNFSFGGFAPESPSGNDIPRTLARGWLAPGPCRGGTPPALPHVEECILFWGVKYSRGIKMAKNKDL